MSKRQFKSQASSSRAASGLTFGGFALASSGSALSYLTEPPNLASISDANVVVAFKNLSKKDAITKAKALEDVRTYVQAHPHTQDGGTEEAVLEAWVKFYPRLSIDNSRRVRELSHNLQYELLKSARKRMEKQIPKIIGSWLAGTFDRDRAVARAAKDGIASFLDTEDKVLMLWKRCQVQILAYAQEAINETAQTLSDERTVSVDDAKAKYFRVIGASLSLVINLLAKLNVEDVSKHQDEYEEFLANNKKLWGFITSEDSFVRRSCGQLLTTCLDRQRSIIDHDLEIISHAFIAEGLRSSQSSSALQLVQTLAKLTSQFPHAWTSAYKSKKSPLSRLRLFIERGSQGGPPEYWKSLLSLLKLVPEGVLPTEAGPSTEFLAAFRDGIAHREESRNNAADAWSSYFDIARLLVTNLKEPSQQSQVLREAVYPVFEQYLFPSADSARWSVGGSTGALARAYLICALAKDPESQESFKSEWQRILDAFITRISTSLPEQSKDHAKSQAAVISESHRWFVLASEVAKIHANGNESVLLHSTDKIVDCAIRIAVNRLGKPYSAAATLEAALRFTPSLIQESPSSLPALQAFLEDHLPKLILSPSSSYLISLLGLFRALKGQELVFESAWQSAIDGLLAVPQDAKKSETIAGLISNDAVTKIGQAAPELQDYIFSAAIASVQGDAAAWAVFEAAVTFGALADSIANKLAVELLPYLAVQSPFVDEAFRALELLCKKRPEILKNGDVHVALITRLLALTELSGEVALRAHSLRSLIEGTVPGESLTADAPIIHIIRENLDIANPQSLSIETLLQQATSVMAAAGPTIVAKLLPDITKWQESLRPLLSKTPNYALGAMRPFAGAVFLNRPVSSERFSKPSRDINGYSVALRMALYSAGLMAGHLDSLPQQALADMLYLTALTVELATDQLDLLEQNKVFLSALDTEASAGMQDLSKSFQDTLTAIVPHARSWRDGNNDGENNTFAAVIHELIVKLIDASTGTSSTSYYSAKALSHLLPSLIEEHGWNGNDGEDWLTNLGILKTTTPNVLGAVAILTGLQESLNTSKVVNNLCNRLISEVAGAAAQSNATLGLMVLLNSCLAVYDEDELPVAQNRLVFAVKQILSWTDTIVTDSCLSAESCRALQRLLPAIKGVYGSYWETTLTFCVAIWESEEPGKKLDQRLAAIGMSLKLVSILTTLDANDDLEDALTTSGRLISRGLICLLKLQRPATTQPLNFVDDLLVRQVTKIPLDHIEDLSEFYPLLASENAMVQSAAFDVLHRAIPAQQERISLEVALEKRDAKLPDELLSLLLDAPSINKFEEEELAEFPTSIRGYLYSWLVVYDAYTQASFKVRNDYDEVLKSEDYIGPLLEFLFDALGHSEANALDLSRAKFDARKIRSYNMREANDIESNLRNMEWLLVHLYYLSLKYTSSLARAWWLDCKSKQTRMAVESWTERFFSPLVIEDTIEEVEGWAEQQDSTEDEKELIIKASRRSREVFASYEVDDMMMQIVIRLPHTYPLDGVKVEGINRVAVSEKKWTSWMMNTQGVITFSNGSITDGLTVFRKNVIGALKGHTECSICYSIISSDKKMPDKRCGTCKNLFHSACLFKWFASSNQSTCPLCRNPFNYGTVSREALRRGN